MSQLIRVFLCYSHDSPGHRERVLLLADRLRQEGIDAWLDRYETHPAQGWPRWIQDEIERARFVVLVCTPTFRRRFEGKEKPESGQGVTWEGLLASQILYEAGARNERFVPIILDSGDAGDTRADEAAEAGEPIPTALRAFTRYRLPHEYDAFYRHITGQPYVVAPPVGELRVMPSREVPAKLPGDQSATKQPGARQPMPPEEPRSDGIPDTAYPANGRPLGDSSAELESPEASEPAGSEPASSAPDGSGSTATMMRGVWIFGGLLLVFFVYVFVFAPEVLPAYKQRMLGISNALLAGLLAAFLTGYLTIELSGRGQERNPGRSWPMVRGAGGLGVFALVLWWWWSPLAPIHVAPSSGSGESAETAPDAAPQPETRTTPGPGRRTPSPADPSTAEKPDAAVTSGGKPTARESARVDKKTRPATNNGRQVTTPEEGPPPDAAPLAPEWRVVKAEKVHTDDALPRRITLDGPTLRPGQVLRLRPPGGDRYFKGTTRCMVQSSPTCTLSHIKGNPAIEPGDLFISSDRP